jgi:hypothetical protein
MKINKLVAALVAASAMSMTAAPSFATVGDSATFKFELPAAASWSGSYPLVASLLLTETATGVDFTLTPNWSNAGGAGFSASSHIEKLDLVYNGPSNATFTSLLGPVIAAGDFEYHSGSNMDAGYQSNAHHLTIEWDDSHSSANRFDSDWASSRWSVNSVGIDHVVLASFADSLHATHSSINFPQPIGGIISVTAYHVVGLHPDTSNWVSPAPEPETYAMFMAGLGLMGFMARRRKNGQS